MESNNKKVDVRYEQVRASPEEIKRRVDAAFAILFRAIIKAIKIIEIK